MGDLKTNPKEMEISFTKLSDPISEHQRRLREMRQELLSTYDSTKKDLLLEISAIDKQISDQIRSNGGERENLTVALDVSLEGEKLPALVVLNGKGKKQLKVITPENVYVTYRDKSWVDTEVMKF